MTVELGSAGREQLPQPRLGLVGRARRRVAEVDGAPPRDRGRRCRAMPPSIAVTLTTSRKTRPSTSTSCGARLGDRRERADRRVDRVVVRATAGPCAPPCRGPSTRALRFPRQPTSIAFAGGLHHDREVDRAGGSGHRSNSGRSALCVIGSSSRPKNSSPRSRSIARRPAAGPTPSRASRRAPPSCRRRRDRRPRRPSRDAREVPVRAARCPRGPPARRAASPARRAAGTANTDGVLTVDHVEAVRQRGADPRRGSRPRPRSRTRCSPGRASRCREPLVQPGSLRRRHGHVRTRPRRRSRSTDALEDPLGLARSGAPRRSRGARPPGPRRGTARCVRAGASPASFAATATAHAPLPHAMVSPGPSLPDAAS